MEIIEWIAKYALPLAASFCALILAFAAAYHRAKKSEEVGKENKELLHQLLSGFEEHKKSTELSIQKSDLAINTCTHRIDKHEELCINDKTEMRREMTSNFDSLRSEIMKMYRHFTSPDKKEHG